MENGKGQEIPYTKEMSEELKNTLNNPVSILQGVNRKDFFMLYDIVAQQCNALQRINDNIELVLKIIQNHQDI